MADIVNPGASAGKLNEGAMPSNQDLVIYKGDFVEIMVILKDGAGVAIPLAGKTGKAQLKLNYADTAPVDFTCTATGTTGQMQISLSSAQSSTLTPGSYIWDFQITEADGKTKTYLAGDVTVYPEVTT